MGRLEILWGRPTVGAWPGFDIGPRTEVKFL